MESELKELLDKIYELEGLVHLAIKRNEALDDFLRLIVHKGKEIGMISENLKEKRESEELNLAKSDASSFDEYSIEMTDSNPLLKEIEETESQEPASGKALDSQRGKLVFSINDRFRYRKELFDNSDADFNNTLVLVASMESYEEAEDYFINEEGFELSNPVVVEFLEVIKKYFR